MLDSLLPQIGLAAGAAAASGLRLYATVAALGLLHRMGVLHLPAGLDVLSQVPIIVLASALYAIEFVADKIPAIDTIWDAVHTFIRVPAAAVLGFAALGNVAEPWRIGAALLCGTVALSSHGIKASSRLAINASPEPFSNWTASFAEDIFTGVLIWLAVSHPVAALVIAGAIVLAALLLATWIVRMLRRLFSRRTAAAGPARP
ncbi:MAG TPA: DUF4126 domain-containing protein [Thermoanaerobaculia bacterium]